MNAWTRFCLAVRRKETPFHARVHDAARRVLGMTVPVIPGLHRFLYREWAARTLAWHNFWRIVYYEPMFKSMCREVGPGFKLWYAGNGICRLRGNLIVRLGENVTMFDNTGLTGLRIFDEPELVVGGNTYIGPLARILVARRISIGAHCILGSRVMLMDNPGHPVEAADRLVPGGGLPGPETVRPVSVGDYCHICTGSYVYPGAEVGDGVVAKIGAHLKGRIPPFALVEGNPCRVVKLLPISGEIRARAGEARYAAWIVEREAWTAEQEPCAAEREAWTGKGKSVHGPQRSGPLDGDARKGAEP